MASTLHLLSHASRNSLGKPVPQPRNLLVLHQHDRVEKGVVVDRKTARALKRKEFVAAETAERPDCLTGHG